MASHLNSGSLPGVSWHDESPSFVPYFVALAAEALPSSHAVAGLTHLYRTEALNNAHATIESAQNLGPFHDASVDFRRHGIIVGDA